jgi:hypothetical protein
MTHGFRSALTVAVIAGWVAVPAGAQQGTSGDHDAHHHDMLARGAEAMGFDQERTVHHFLLTEDGGAIDVGVMDPADEVNRRAVRQHLQEIAVLFKAGDFSKPVLTHAQQVPGSGEMARLKDRIAYTYEETPAGGRVKIVTHDTAALEAVHTFLRFQIEDHRTGDPIAVSAPASGHAMPGMQAGAAGGGHDAGMMSQMGDIHELFSNHDRITRTVTNLPDGIRTMTESADPHVAQLIKDHVTGMGQVVETGRDPGLPIESPALRLIYRNHDRIETAFQTTAAGIIVVQTSTDPETVSALQQHAAEVSEFVKDGMAAMHRAMMGNGGGMMHGGAVGTMPHDQATPGPR